MTDVPALHFDGRSTEPRAVTVRWNAFDGVFELRGPDGVRRLPRRDVTVVPRTGPGPRMLRLSDGGRCEVADDPVLDAVIATWAPGPPATGWRRPGVGWTAALLVLAALVALGWATVQFGVPWAAHKVALRLPADLLRSLGDQTLASLDQTSLRRTQLTHERQLALRAQFTEFLAKSGQTAPHAIEFRAMPDGGANAFALPSGVIVITDELVHLARDDREIVAVLAHECGHLEHRHALRGVLQDSGMFALFALLTGDMSSASTFGGALSTQLLQSNYSRAFEREADAHAVETLRRAGLSPDHLATMLQRLATSQGGDGPKVLGYLSTHPPSAERIEAIRGPR